MSSVLPTKVSLQHIYVPVDSVCPVCNAADETILHVLVSCPFAGQCWSGGFRAAV